MSVSDQNELADDLELCHINDDGLGTSASLQPELFDDLIDSSGLPRILIIGGIPESVFDEQEARTEFEALFKVFESSPQFEYLKSFRRARVTYDSPSSATLARVHLHEREFHGSCIKCYFAHPIDSEETSTTSSPYLLPPKPEKQFLISPPSSPPVGWDSVPEKQPTINYDLIAAISNLAPGEAHELEAPSDTKPGIIIHICEDPEGYKDRPQILQTHRPISF